MVGVLVFTSLSRLVIYKNCGEEAMNSLISLLQMAKSESSPDNIVMIYQGRVYYITTCVSVPVLWRSNIGNIYHEDAFSTFKPKIFHRAYILPE